MSAARSIDLAYAERRASRWAADVEFWERFEFTSRGLGLAMRECAWRGYLGALENYIDALGRMA